MGGMDSTNRSRQKQVRLTSFDNEPMARLAEQRLWESGIPCITRSLRGGPGLWGSAYNLPHDVYVFESDQVQARMVLDLPEAQEQKMEWTPRKVNWALWLAVAAITVGLALGIVVPLISNSS